MRGADARLSRLDRILARVAARLRMQAAAGTLADFLLPVLCAEVILVAVWRWGGHAGVVTWLGLPVAAALAAALVVWGRRPASRLEAANAADRDAVLAERLSTLAEAREAGRNRPMDRLQREDALSASGRLDGRAVARWSWPSRARWLVLPLAAAAALALTAPEPALREARSGGPGGWGGISAPAAGRPEGTPKAVPGEPPREAAEGGAPKDLDALRHAAAEIRATLEAGAKGLSPEDLRALRDLLEDAERRLAEMRLKTPDREEMARLEKIFDDAKKRLAARASGGSDAGTPPETPAPSPRPAPGAASPEGPADTRESAAVLARYPEEAPLLSAYVGLWNEEAARAGSGP